MATKTGNAEPTRPLPEPRTGSDGNWHATASLSPKEMKTRARLPVPSSKIIPVIVIPGIMGSNLRATAEPGQRRNTILNPGEAAWRPPNGVSAGLDEARKWRGRPPAVRQKILNSNTLEVDPDGEIDVPASNDEVTLDPATLRQRGWGEIHLSSYGRLLITLQTRLNKTFRTVWENRFPVSHWLMLNKFDRANWGTTNAGVMSEISDAELMKFAEYHYPVYAFGYNWLQSNQLSADRLTRRIEAIIAEWTAAQKQCTSVILVTHSMGGFVGRACAKQIPAKILGVIHGAMPALGAPVCYRRITCGTESSSPHKGMIENEAMDKFADIAGRTAADTTAVMATASGPLELLPNHLYPEPWLFATVASQGGAAKEVVKLPKGNPYDLYRDTDVWYRLIDPSLVDPAGLHKGEALRHVCEAIKTAEVFHTTILDSYYHPNTYAFYGVDRSQLSFGACHWATSTSSIGLTSNELQSGKPVSRTNDGARNVAVNGGKIFTFKDVSVPNVQGDGTVPMQSGAGPAGKVSQLFRTSGYDHQGSYNNEAMLYLTQHLIAKMVQKI